MALAAVGVFVAYTDATDTPKSPYLVAATPIRMGEVIDERHLRIAHGAVPEEMSSPTFADPAEVTGRVALGPIGAGELLQAGLLSDDAGTGHEVALVLPRPQVAVGRLKEGELVDVFSTADERTQSVVRAVPVVQIDAGESGSLTSERALTLVVSVPDADSVAALVHALRTGDITVVRSTFTSGDDDPLSHPADLDPDHGAEEASP
ncbi:MAG: SAF domain-containing protein [Acidimicrobiales bacterium]